MDLRGTIESDEEVVVASDSENDLAWIGPVAKKRPPPQTRGSKKEGRKSRRPGRQAPDSDSDGPQKSGDFAASFAFDALGESFSSRAPDAHAPLVCCSFLALSDII